MADSESPEDKNNPATPKKREEARKKGDVAMSKDLTTWLTLWGGFVACAALAPGIGASANQFTRRTFGMMGTPMNGRLGGDFIDTYAAMVLPLLLIGLALGMIATFGQTKGMFSMEKLTKPDLQKFNVFMGIKRIFLSVDSLIELGMSMLKVISVAIVAGWTLWEFLLKFFSSEPYDLSGMVTDTLWFTVKLGGRLAAATLVLAAIDYAVKNYQYEKKLKMSDKEIKDEHKNTEGDGEIKGKRKAMARDLLQQLTTEGVKGADVVVVNPTHFSVALKYDRESMAAPRVVAKGVDQRAMRIRQIARENGVPIVSKPPLARALFRQVKVGRSVPGELFQAVAEVLAYVYRLKKNRRRKAS